MNKVAIVFWSATGNTETMANCVAEGANGTIVPCGEMNAAKLAEFDFLAAASSMVLRSFLLSILPFFIIPHND